MEEPLKKTLQITISQKKLLKEKLKNENLLFKETNEIIKNIEV